VIRTYTDRDLYSRNTFGIRVSCACYISYDSFDDLSSIDFDSLPKPLMFIGAGSNILFTKDFPGTILHSVIKYVRQVGGNEEEVLVDVGAGVLFDDLVKWACDNRFWGLENLSSIPGEVGAAAVQNIGAYGVEVKESILRVNCFDIVERKQVSFNNSECRYGYRESRFKSEKGRYVITSVLFRLSNVFNPRTDYRALASALEGKKINCPDDIRKAVSEIRASKLPDPKVLGSAGSFFKNPVVSAEQYESYGGSEKVPGFPAQNGVKVPAAWMIEQCGLKGFSVGGAEVYPKQPLVIVNRSGDASPQDVMELERIVMDRVKERFGVTLQFEVEHV